MDLSAAIHRVQFVLAAARKLPCDHVSRLQVLYSLLEISDSPADASGRSIAALADRAALTLEATRHAVRTLRMDGHVAIAGRLGKTELFTLSPATQRKLIDCLDELNHATSKKGEARHAGNGDTKPVSAAP